MQLSIEQTPPVSKQTHYDILQVSNSATPDEIKASYRILVVGCHPDKVPPVPNKDMSQNDASSDVLVSKGLAAIDLDDDDDEEEENDIACIKSDVANTGETSALATDKAEPIQYSEPIIESEESTSILFHQLQAAYKCLSDPTKRRQYDESINRKGERDTWKFRGATEVNLSEMDSDMCCIVDEDSSDDEVDSADGEGAPLEKVYFHPCRCGDTFQVVQEELLESISAAAKRKTDIGLTDRVWQCESCCLTIRINVDIDVD